MRTIQLGVLGGLICALLACPPKTGHAFSSFGPNVHEGITREAAKGSGMSALAIDRVVRANFKQDDDEVTLDLTVGHAWFVPKPGKYAPEHHFDRNEGDDHVPAFRRAAKYYRLQRNVFTQRVMNGGDLEEAFKALGAACHGIQDLWAHSNMVDLAPAELFKVAEALDVDYEAPLPQGFKLTAYSKATGLDPVGDPYGHDAHCKDGIIAGVKKLGESADRYDDKMNKYEAARSFATNWTRLYLIQACKQKCGASWARVERF